MMCDCEAAWCEGLHRLGACPNAATVTGTAWGIGFTFCESCDEMRAAHDLQTVMA